MLSEAFLKLFANMSFIAYQIKSWSRKGSWSRKANNRDNYWGITLFPTLCKSLRWCSSIDLKTMYQNKGYFLICSSVLKKE